MSFIKSYVNGYAFYHTEEAQGIPEWFIKKNSEKWSRPFHSSRHSTVLKVQHPVLGDLFIKKFDPKGLLIKIKDSLRGSRAFRAWKAGEMLGKYGFKAPEVVAVVEKIKLGILEESFLLTLPVKGILFLEAFTSIDFHKKRKIISLLGREIGRMHRAGIIHGDLLPDNLFIISRGEGCFICFLDNEATKKVFKLSLNQRIKNMVQLNRMVILGITASDRVRFFDAYLLENPHLESYRDEMLREIGKITAERVMRHRGIPIKQRKGITFRELMCANRDIVLKDGKN